MMYQGGNAMRNTSECKELVLLGTTIALEISQDMTAEELAKMSGFFYIIADELALLSLCAPAPQGEQAIVEEDAALF